MIKHPITGVLACLLAVSLHASPIDEMKTRYPGTTLTVGTDADAQPEGLFYLRGNIQIDAARGASHAGANQTRDPALAKAEQFFDESPAFFAAGAGDMRLHKRTTDRFGNQHLRFQRVLNGIPVADMEVLVHLNAEGDITGVNGHIVRPSKALLSHMTDNTTPTLTKLEALQRVANQRGTDISGVRLLNAEMLLANEAPHIRWHLDVNPSRGVGRFSYWLDAQTGALIDVQNTLRHPIPLNR
ncbi:hypothetical protein [Simiduia aestuariiviva]|uniref:Zn-dependent metalloprotease n=1 Tax=Simiduia aestuariiviva TaxID=1510459 RepID=A0A839UP18_9GAMM|nr:hypothetical protein [Simiduia aestuariiviva]MBB3167308.1 Zn-dependent metalloprotease [Simiduia aestuariiviva]